MKIAGVYKITNNITGDFYIGSSKDIKLRWVSHRNPAAQKRLPNSKLYKAMAEFGLDNFKFEVLEETADLKEREQYWIEKLKPSYNNNWAKGLDIERSKETHKEWHKSHRNEHLTKMKDYYYTHRDKQLSKRKDHYYTHRDEHLAKCKAYRSRLCLYEGETLTLNTLSSRFCRQGIPQPTLEAKKYLIERGINDESL